MIKGSCGGNRATRGGRRRRLELLAWASVGGWAGLSLAASGEEPERERIQVLSAQHPGDGGFRFDLVPPPAVDDAASGADVRLIDGERDPNGGPPRSVIDGRLPTGDDQPRANFFFRAGGEGGRLVIDLGSAIRLTAVHSYSWHRGVRGPQLYTLYAAAGDEAGFDPEPGRGLDPAERGWRRIARVDTRPGPARGGAPAEGGGQHGVAILSMDDQPMGRFRYLLFDVERLQRRDAFGHTFFSEIDVIDADAPAPEAILAPAPERLVRSYGGEEGGFRYTIDLGPAPDLAGWVEERLMPVVEAWYPKIIALLPSEGYEAPVEVRLEFRDDMGGTPAYAAANRVAMNAVWFRRQLDGEALGCVVHELVHVVQSYRRARFTNRNPLPVAGWVTEGIADYIRWFLYEPAAGGASLTRRNIDRARHDASYRISAHFIDWAIRGHDADLLRKLNAAAREGRLHDEMWEEWTGHDLAELEKQWLGEARLRLGL